MATSLVCMYGNPIEVRYSLRMDHIERIILTDVDLKRGPSLCLGKHIEEVKRCAVIFGECVEIVDLLRPAPVRGVLPVFGVDEGLRREGDNFMDATPGAKEEGSESTRRRANHDNAIDVRPVNGVAEKVADFEGRVADPGYASLIPAATYVTPVPSTT
jgi:hypothetical protein